MSKSQEMMIKEALKGHEGMTCTKLVEAMYPGDRQRQRYAIASVSSLLRKMFVAKVLERTPCGPRKGFVYKLNTQQHA